MAPRFILALDQGTTSSRSIIFDHEGHIVAKAQEEFRQIYPRPGWVEHDPEAIWDSQRRTAENAIEQAGANPDDIAAIGISNQRETVLIWDRKTGAPLHNAIVWQCRRTAERCAALREAGLESEIRERTGLVLDPYFSATKLAWLLDHVEGARKSASRGELCAGTIDAWLLHKLTGNFGTDHSNASRTQLYNLHTNAWDEFLLDTFEIPREALAPVQPTSHIFGTTTAFGGEIPVAALVGDQQAALFGQAAFEPGDCKNTYGTGGFLLMNTGTKPVPSKHGLLTTVAWQLEGQTTYALEGSVFVAGAAIQWLRDELRILHSARDSETLAASVPDNGGVYFVPAFVGLGAPYWDAEARGLLLGLRRNTSRAHIARAALESISFQTADLLECMEKDSGRGISELRVDGGAAENDLLLEHQANVSNCRVVRGKTLETTALGAAFLAGVAVGFWRSLDNLREVWEVDRSFDPEWGQDKRECEVNAWHDAVSRSRSSS